MTRMRVGEHGAPRDFKPHPRFGDKQTQSLRPRDVGIGGGPPKNVPSVRGDNRAIDTGVRGPRAATAANDARSSRGTQKHSAVVNRTTLAENRAGHVEGQDPEGAKSPGLKRQGTSERSTHYEPDGGEFHNSSNKHGGHHGSLRHLGKHGRHESVKGHEHSGYTHTSEDR